jgi:hypothetical protein
MKSHENLLLNSIYEYVEQNIGVFHSKRIESLNALKLNKVLKRKNPYLFKAKNVLTAQEIVKGIVDAHISSNEETIFGDWLEGLAIFINKITYGGWKSGITGIDLEFDKDGKRYIVDIKSGPNWGNSNQIAKMRDNFRKAIRTLRTSNSNITVVAVNGCCYGRENNPDKGDYFKYCGQEFWYFISGNEDVYVRLIKPLGYKAKEKNDEFIMAYSKMLNKFTAEFISRFCKSNGDIDWNELVRFNSGSKKLQ